MQHNEDYASSASKDEQYFESYADVGVHKVMLTDRPRMDFYRTILANPAVVEGKVVVDVGSGTGILSCWAAQAGAAHVLSIEASSMAAVQQRVVDENGLASQVTVIASTVEHLIEEGVQAFLAAHPIVRRVGGIGLVVSEWMGFYLFHECMLPSVLRARDFFHAVNASLEAAVPLQMIPSHGRLRAAPISLEPYYEDAFAPFWSDVDGVCLSTLGRMAFEEHIEAASPLVDVMPSRCLLHESEVFWSGSFDHLQPTELLEVSATRTFDFSASTMARQRVRDAGALVVDGFTLWFEVSYGTTALDTSPVAPPTHWKQTTVLLPREVREDALVTLDGTSETLELHLRLTAQDLAQRYYRIEFELN